MACSKSKKPKPPKKTIFEIASDRAKERIATIDTARKVKLEDL